MRQGRLNLSLRQTCGANLPFTSRARKSGSINVARPPKPEKVGFGFVALYQWGFVLMRYQAHVPEVDALKAIQKPNLVSHS